MGGVPGTVITGHQVVPAGFAAYLRGVARVVSRSDMNDLLAAAVAAGWTLMALGDVLGVSRETIRQRVARGDASRCPAGRVPDPPRWPVYPPPPPRVEVPEADAVRLRALHAQSRMVNGSTPVDHPGRAASVELAALLAVLWDGGGGYSLNAMARAYGVTHAAVALRLSRFGYRAPVPSQTPYLGRPRDGWRRVKCSEGHDMVGDNVVERRGGRGMERLCRACYEARRRSRYS